MILHSSRCLDKGNFFPPGRNPIVCDQRYSPPTKTFAMLCCHIRNFCNADIHPQLVQDELDVTTTGKEGL